MHFDSVVIVGVGLLGGSIGLALRERQLATRIIGVGRSADSLHAALERGAISETETDLQRACDQADLVVICTPVQLVAEYIAQCLPPAAPNAIVTDVGSTKRTICEAVAATEHGRFCGAHPLAGSDRSGVAYADANLFENKLTIVTPTAATTADCAARTEGFWQALGSRTLRMSPAEHDLALAHTSHLPHVVAAVLAGNTPRSLLPLAASGWCDTTRVAAGNVELWRQIICENREPVLAALRGFADSLGPWLAALESNDDTELTRLLQLGKQQRDSVGN